MFDIESLGKYSDAVILSIACTPFRLDDNKSFDQYLLESFHVKINSVQQVKAYSRSLDADTIEWWGKQSPECKALATKRLSTDVDFADSMIRLSKFLVSKNYDLKRSYLWARGSSYDFPKIEHAFDQVRKEHPSLPVLNYRKIRDTRTYIDILAGVDTGFYSLKTPLPENFISHYCLHDTVREVMVMTELFRSSFN